MLQKIKAIISISNYDKGQTDLIKMHIATKPNASPIVVQPYHNVLKQKLKNLLDAQIIQKSMSPWASPIVLVKKHTQDGALQQFCLCIDHRKVNSL